VDLPRKRHTEVSHYDDAGAVGRRLREARERAGLSQRQLSFPGCSPAYLSRIEAGDRTPSLQLMRELARRLGVTEDYLAYGIEEGAHTDPLLEAEVALRMDDRKAAEELYRAELDSENPGRRAGALEGLGQLAFRDGRLAESVELLEAAREQYGDKAAERDALNATLGRALAHSGDLEASIGVLTGALRSARERDDLLAEVRFAVLLSAAFSDAGRYADAEETVASVLGRAEELSDPMARIRLYWAQSRLHTVAQRPALAEQYGRKVIELLELTEDTYNLAGAYRLMARIKLDQDKPDEALELVERAQAILAGTGHHDDDAVNKLVEANALAALGRLDEAASLAMSLRDDLSARPEETGHSYSVLAKTFAQAGERARAIELYELACELLEDTPSRHLVTAYAELAEVLDAEGRKDEALEVLRKAVRIRTEAGIRV
jgi:tetratricopeptide (TPR) repeat protein